MCNYQMLVERSVSNRLENKESEDGMTRKKLHVCKRFQKSHPSIYSDLINQNNVVVVVVVPVIHIHPLLKIKIR